jgi:hypothetical protein
MLWQFPLPQHAAHLSKEETLALWNRLHGQQAANQLLRQLVLSLRIWRPDLVITDHPDPQVTDCGADALVAEALHEAFRLAADPKAFPEQIKALGLEPWRVSKLYARWEGRSGAQVMLDLTTPCRRLEDTARDFASGAEALLRDQDSDLPNRRYYHLLDTRLADGAGHRQLMEGIVLAPGGVARRAQAPAAELKPEAVKSIRARETFRRLTDAAAGRLADPSTILSQIGPLLAGLSDEQGAATAFALANRFAAQGQWTLAQETFLLMVDKYPAHPLAASAYRWLLRHNCSSEARRRSERGQFLLVTHSETDLPSKPLDPEQLQSIGLKERSQLFSLGKQSTTRQWHRGGADFGQRLAAFGALYATDPSIQFCLQTARRQTGESDAARHWYQRFQEQQSEGPWHDAAASELWLTSQLGTSPKPVARCRQTGERPLLDGQFDDPCWRGLKPLVLRNAVGDTVEDYPTEAWLAYDKEYLYLALRCQHPPTRHVPPVKVRKRDEDLRHYDRVSLLLDLDRDYSTWFHFQVDQRGCVFEDCWGDKTWNPRWFVAARSTKSCWQIEAAIPLVELLGDQVLPGNAWACNVVRILPGRGVQAWSVPADVEPRPEGMGLLLFTSEQGEPETTNAAQPGTSGTAHTRPPERMPEKPAEGKRSRFASD